MVDKFPTADDFRFGTATGIKNSQARVIFGVAATGQLPCGQFSIIAPNAEVCRHVWDLLKTIEMDESGLQEVVVCKASHLELKPEKALFRVAAIKTPAEGLITETADNADEADELEKCTGFVRWLTDWQEAEVTN